MNKNMYREVIFNQPEFKEQREYWESVVNSELKPVEILSDYRNPRRTSDKKKRYQYEFPGQLSVKLTEISRDNDLALFMVLFAAFKFFLSAQTGNAEVLIALPLFETGNKKNAPDIYNDRIFIKERINYEFSVKEFLTDTRDKTMEAFKNQDYPVDLAFKKAGAGMEQSRFVNQLFFSMENIQNELTVKTLPYRIFFSINREGKRICIDVEYDQNLYGDTTVKHMIERYVYILGQFTENSKKELCRIDTLLPEERQKVLVDFNRTGCKYNNQKTIHGLFEEQVIKTPHKTAVVFGNEKITYKELNARANKLARMIRQTGIAGDSIVGIMMERSIEFVIAVFGILKAGGALLPIDPEFPHDRVRYMLEDSKAALLLVNKPADNQSLRISVMDIKESMAADVEDINPEPVSTAGNLLYVIYTSGTTGNPKGVMLEHGNMVNLLNFEYNATCIEWESRVMQFTTMCFDVCYQEIFSTLLKGGELHIIEDEKKRDIFRMIDFINKNEINVLFLPASLVKSVLGEDVYLSKLKTSVKHIITAGEQLIVPDALKKYLQSNNVFLHNHYGPSETHVVTAVTLEPGTEIDEIPSIGKPIFNTRIYILDRKMNPVPVGVPGEVHISGDSVGRGYINASSRNANRYTEDPFYPGERMYKTGDLARWLPDGNIDFLGRMDHQVKIRGYRIEPEEIELQILNLEQVKDASVIVKKDANGNAFLCAYVVTRPEGKISEVREYLQKKLPDYMIPSYFLKMDILPLTVNGKVDKRALPEPDFAHIDRAEEFVEPEGEVQKKLAKIWCEILNLDSVGADSDFFRLGGHSLKATILSARINREFQVEVPLKVIFDAPTITALADFIVNTETTGYLPIVPVEKQDFYEVSSSQKRIYILSQMEGNDITYNLPMVRIMEGEADIERLSKVFRELILRHEALRTSFDKINGEIVQIIHDQVPFDIEYSEADEAESTRIIESFIRPFDLRVAPLVRVGLIKTADKRYIIMFDTHHIISDGMSLTTIIRELGELYQGAELPRQNIQYKDYAVWQNKMIQSGALKKQEEYWLSRFKGTIPVLDMPLDYTRPPVQSFDGEGLNSYLDSRLSKELKEFAQKHGVTVYTLFMAVYYTLLSRYSGQDDIVVGTPVAGRQHADVINTVGMFVNTLAIRAFPHPSKTFSDFLGEVQADSIQAIENQNYQFEVLVEKLNIQRDISRNPLFDTMFVFENMGSMGVRLENICFKPYRFESRISKFDCILFAFEEEDTIRLYLEYNIRLFKRETAERMLYHFINLLQEAIACPDKKLQELNMLSSEDMCKILYDYNNTEAQYPMDKTLHQIFEEQVEKVPDKIAVVFEENKITYRELNRKANRLAARLGESGVRRESIVGIMTDRSVEMIIGILAILKAGGAFMPISPECPRDRIRFMMEDSGAKVLLTQQRCLYTAEFNGVETLVLENEDLYIGKGSNPERINKENDLAYIIYTSGSTGKPKGVMIEHTSAVNILTALQKKYPLTEGDTYLLKTEYTFDVSVAELFGWFLGAGKLAVLKPGEEKEPGRILEAIDRYNVTHINFVPSMFNIFVNLLKEGDEKKLEKLKYLFLAGEAVTVGSVRKFAALKTGTRIENLYGPTESTIYASSYPLNHMEERANVPIGKPMDNIQLYILDRNLNLNPVGVPGELCISGVGLARGYLNNHSLTGEKFIEHPLVPGKKLYRTGDKARWSDDGNIEFLGRMDMQVKVRGFRIEPGEIETVLLGHRQVKESVLKAWEEKDGNALCAYVVAEKDMDISELREYLQKKLPYYMIPAYFVVLDDLPRNQSGKIDRKNLPEPKKVLLKQERLTAPRNETETMLASIWREVLDVETGIKDNFFEIGGHSIKATELVSKIQRDFHVDFPLKQVFAKPVLECMAKHIMELEKINRISVPVVEEREYYPLSVAQKRIYIVEQLLGGATTYNMPAVLNIEGSLDIDRLQNIFCVLIGRHPALRTSFEIKDGEPVQKIHERFEFHVEFSDLSHEGEKGNMENAVREKVNLFIRPFNLKSPPLLRVGAIKQNDGKYVLMFDMHHIIGDGKSMDILMKEFHQLYRGGILPDLKVQFKDYSVWQYTYMSSDSYKNQEKYWMNRFADGVPVLELDTDFPRPQVQTFQGDTIFFEYGSELTGRLKKCSKETGATLFMILAANFHILLSKYSDCEDIVVGVPVAGRHHAELENVIGLFINMLALRSSPESGKTFAEFLDEMKEHTLGAFENQDYQLEDMIEKLGIQRGQGRNTMFDVVFSVQNVFSAYEGFHDMKVTPYWFESKDSRFDLGLVVEETNENIRFSWTYCVNLFRSDTVYRMMEDYRTILDTTLENPVVLLGDIKLKREFALLDNVLEEEPDFKF